MSISSGNRHPTAGYLITAGCPGLAGGVYHSHDHCLERRGIDVEGSGDTREARGVILAMTSVHWREAWKYGLRAYRYCQQVAAAWSDLTA
ncbi:MULTISPECIES: nitroreductase family protein [Thiorhodovibrio]|uniref:hypothetical protein n=1 Tax=Thiorhodovibrio TaxID=61593 RepID=UPI001F5CB81D|nr:MULTISPECIES: hypothetical protein [Thiorhodovibrio]